MGFLKRLGFYLFGLAIGLVFLAIFLKKKSDETGVEFCYFPNCRTLKDIRSKPLSYSDEVLEIFKTTELDTLDIKYLLSQGDVDFRKSDTKTKDCKTYFIDGDINGKKRVLKIANCQDRAAAIWIR